MANIPPIQFRRSSVSGSIPAASDLLEGEIALNLSDRKIYTKDSLGEVISIGGAGIVAVDSEQVLNGFDSDEFKHKEIVVFDIKENRLISWDSDTDTFEPIGAAAGGADIQVQSTPPTTQSDGTALESGDLWFNTDDANDYDHIYMYSIASDNSTAWIGIG